ncbi:MAG TPA: alpha/beta hydrolase [Xylella sp.]
MLNPIFPGTSSTLFLEGPAGSLEVAIDFPESNVRMQSAIAIVCHPLSTEGGSMHNKVVTMTARALRELGIITVRFNFRSVGASDGKFDGGDGERADLRAVAAWVRVQHPSSALWLAGFSFGAYVSLQVAEELESQALISVAPPVGRWDLSNVHPPQHWLLIQGDADEVVDPQAVYKWIHTLPRQPQLIRMPDTSHFFHRKLMNLRDAIQNGVRSW